MFVKKRHKKKLTKQNELKSFIGDKAHEIIYVFDKFGKPIVKSWRPNPIQKLDDFGDINYNTSYVNYYNS